MYNFRLKLVYDSVSYNIILLPFVTFKTKCFSVTSRSLSFHEHHLRAKMGKKRKDAKHSPLMALLPGAKIDNEKGNISINVGISSETVIFNIGGINFETFRSTLLKQPESFLSDPSFLSRYYRQQQGDYFFDRDPGMFKVIVKY